MADSDIVTMELAESAESSEPVTPASSSVSAAPTGASTTRSGVKFTNPNLRLGKRAELSVAGSFSLGSRFEFFSSGYRGPKVTIPVGTVVQVCQWKTDLPAASAATADVAKPTNRKRKLAPESNELENGGQEEQAEESDSHSPEALDLTSEEWKAKFDELQRSYNAQTKQQTQLKRDNERLRENVAMLKGDLARAGIMPTIDIGIPKPPNRSLPPTAPDQLTYATRNRRMKELNDLSLKKFGKTLREMVPYITTETTAKQLSAEETLEFMKFSKCSFRTIEYLRKKGLVASIPSVYKVKKAEAAAAAAVAQAEKESENLIGLVSAPSAPSEEYPEMAYEQADHEQDFANGNGNQMYQQNFGNDMPCSSTDAYASYMNNLAYYQNHGS